MKKMEPLIKQSMATKAELISQLKTKGVRGKLSKMSKSQLLELTREQKGSGSLELESDDDERVAGAGKRPPSTYQAFVAKHLKENGGDMKAAAAAYREQKGSGLAGDIGRKVGKAVTHGAVGVARGVRDAVKEELHHKKDDHKGGSTTSMTSMSDHAKHHSDKHMDVMEREMDDGASFDDAHDSAMEQVGSGIDQYMAGGSYWADKDFSMATELQGSGDWYNPFSWSSGTQQAVGTVLQTAGMMGLMALGGPEAEAAMGAEEGQVATKAMSSAEKEALELKDTRYLSDSPMNPDYKPPRPTPVRDIDPQTRFTSTSSSGSSASEGLRGSTTLNPEALDGSEVAGDTLGDDTAATSDKEPLFHTPEPASDEALEGTEEDSESERIKKNVNKMKRLVKEGKHAAARKLREGLVDKYGVGVDVKAGEGWGKYLQRVGYKVMIPSLSVEAGEKLKTEGEQKESFTKMEATTGAVTEAIEDAEKGLGANQANIMQEIQRERQRNLASEWQRARDRTYNPYMS